jgi:hypothetical protein
MRIQNPNDKPGRDTGDVGRMSGPEGGQSQTLPRRLFDPDDNSHLAHLPTIALNDSNGLLRAHGHYGNSWKKRGGIGAFMMLARKIDRLEKFCGEHGYDIFAAMDADTRGEGIIDDIRDLRRYLLLVEAEATARGFECCSVRHRDNLEETGKATRGFPVVIGGPGTCLQDVGERFVDNRPGPGFTSEAHAPDRIEEASNRHEAQAKVFKEVFGTQERPKPNGSVSDPHGRQCPPGEYAQDNVTGRSA